MARYPNLNLAMNNINSIYFYLCWGFTIWMMCLPMLRTTALLTVLLRGTILVSCNQRQMWMVWKIIKKSRKPALYSPFTRKMVQDGASRPWSHTVALGDMFPSLPWTHTLNLFFIPCSITISYYFLSWNNMKKMCQLNALMEYELAFIPLPMSCFRSFVRPTYRTVFCTQLQPFNVPQHVTHPPIPTQTHAYTLRACTLVYRGCSHPLS